MSVTNSNSVELPQGEAGAPASIAGFVVRFAILLLMAEAALRGIGWLQDKVGWAILDSGFNLQIAGLSAALLNGLLSLTAMVALFAFFEWRQLGFRNFKERYVQGLIFGSTALIIAVVLQAMTFSWLATFEITPLFSAADLGPALVLLPMLYMVIIGFFEYWLHRALHDIPVLWRLHAIHHQIEDLNAARSYSHWAQDALYLAVISVPLIFLIESPEGPVAILTTFYLVSNYYMHSDSSAFSFPPALRHLIADNVYHHHHHSRAIEHWGKNYCSFFSFYDRIFGTQHMPQDETFHPTGIDGYRPLDGWRDYLIRPFTKEG